MIAPDEFTRSHALSWWLGLAGFQAADVRDWLEQNPPPPEWQGNAIEYAYEEMPVPWSWVDDGWGDDGWPE